MISAMAMSLSDYRFTSKDRLLLDTNVWLLVHGPRGPETDLRVDSYTRAYKRILQARSCVHIDLLVVSEIIGGVVKIRCRLAKYGSIRKFIKSSDYPPAAREAADIIRRILRCCLRIDDRFSSMPVDRVVDAFSEGRAEFNDQVLTHVCRREGLTLVTDDGGFRGSDVPVLTANAALLG